MKAGFSSGSRTEALNGPTESLCRKLGLCLLIASSAVLGSRAACAQVTWSMTSLEQVVPPMRHHLDGFMPILPAGLPIPSDVGAAVLQRNGTLGEYVAALAARGLALPVRMYDDDDTVAGAVATARTLQAAGLPIHVWTSLHGDSSLAPDGFAHDPGTAFWPWGASPNAWAKDGGGNYWPAFPLASPAAGYALMKSNLQVLADAGISTIAGIWTDYEDFPAYWADMKASINQRTYFSQYYTNAYAERSLLSLAQYGPGLLTNDTMNQNNPMWRYSYDLLYALLKSSARQAITDVYGPAPLYGNFGAYYSTSSIPFTTDGTDFHPPSPPPEAGIVAMPVAYADTVYLANDFADRNPSKVPVNQATVDDVYWYNMLKQISSSQANDGAIGKSVPWVSSYVPDNTSPAWVNWRMSISAYKELLRHIWLRGASGMYVFNPGPPYRPPQEAFDELAYASEVLDEMLAFRKFLLNGVPMNYGVNSSRFGGAVEWSGMSNRRTDPTQWVVRTVSRTGSDAVVPRISPERGLIFRDVPAPAAGATFLLNADGRMKRVE